MSAAQKDTLTFIGKWVIGILLSMTGFLLSVSYVSMTSDIRDINARLYKVEGYIEAQQQPKK